LAPAALTTVAPLSVSIGVFAPPGYVDALQKLYGQFYDTVVVVVITPPVDGSMASGAGTMKDAMESHGVFSASDFGFLEKDVMQSLVDRMTNAMARNLLMQQFVALAGVAATKLSEVVLLNAGQLMTHPIAMTTAAVVESTMAEPSMAAPLATAPAELKVTGNGSAAIKKKTAPGATAPSVPKKALGKNGGVSYKEVVKGGAAVNPPRSPGDPFPPLHSFPMTLRDDDDADDDSSNVTSPRSDRSDSSSVSSNHPKKIPSASHGSAVHAASLASLRSDWHGDETICARTTLEAAGYGQGLPLISAGSSLFLHRVKIASNGKSAKQFLISIGDVDGVAPAPVIGMGGRNAWHPFPHTWDGVHALYGAMEKSICPDPTNPQKHPQECLRQQQIMKDLHADHQARMRTIAGAQDPWSGHPHPTCFHTFFNCMLVYWAAIKYCIGVLGQPDELRDTLRQLFNMAAAQGCFTKEVDQIDLHSFKAMLMLAGVQCGSCRRPGCTEQVCPTCGVNVFGHKSVDRKATEAEAKTNTERKAAIAKWQADDKHKERLTLSSRDAYRQWTKAPEGVSFVAAHRTGVSSTRPATSTAKSIRLTEEEALLALLKNFNKIPKPFSLMPISRQ
jgi:hypothetical protein